MATCADCECEFDDPMLDDDPNYGLCSKCADDLRSQLAASQEQVRVLQAQESRYMQALEWLARQVDRPNPPLCDSCKVDGHSPWFCAALKHVDEQVGTTRKEGGELYARRS